MQNRKNVFWITYAIIVASTVLNYKKQYGASVLSLAGIIDCFAVPFIGAAVVTALISLGFRLFHKFVKTDKEGE